MSWKNCIICDNSLRESHELRQILLVLSTAEPAGCSCRNNSPITIFREFNWLVPELPHKLRKIQVLDDTLLGGIPEFSYDLDVGYGMYDVDLVYWGSRFCFYIFRFGHCVLVIGFHELVHVLV